MNTVAQKLGKTMLLSVNGVAHYSRLNLTVKRVVMRSVTLLIMDNIHSKKG